MVDNIKNAAVRDLSFVIGHDAANKGGKFPLPARIRRSIDLSNLAGLVTGNTAALLGAGAAQQRIDNANLIDAALDSAIANGKYVESGPDRFDVNAPFSKGGIKAGINFRSIPGLYMGSASIVQYAVNYPAQSIGVVYDGNAGGAFHCEPPASGFGVSQAGQTSAVAILLGSFYYGKVESLNAPSFIDGVSDFPGYLGIGMTAAGGFFSNYIPQTVAVGLQYHFLHELGTSGNAWGIIHLGKGDASSRYTMGGLVAFRVHNGYFGTVDELNIEWSLANAVLQVENCRNMVIGKLHVEGNKGTDATFGMSLVNSNYSQVKIGQITALNNEQLNSGGSTYGANILSLYGANSVDIDAISGQWDGGTGQKMERPLNVISHDTSTGDYSDIRIGDVNLGGAGLTGAVNVDSILTSATFGETGQGRVGNYQFSDIIPLTRNSIIILPSGVGNFTAYGAHQGAKYVLNTPITADRKLILNDKLTNTGPGVTATRAIGDTVKVSRTAAATGAFNLNIYAADGTTLITSIAAGGAVKKLVWGGTTWTAY